MSTIPRDWNSLWRSTVSARELTSYAQDQSYKLLFIRKTLFRTPLLSPPTVSTACLSEATVKSRAGIEGGLKDLMISQTVLGRNEWHMAQLLAASACRGQFSSSMPESYSSSAGSLAGALQFRWKLQFSQTRHWSVHEHCPIVAPPSERRDTDLM